MTNHRTRSHAPTRDDVTVSDCGIAIIDGETGGEPADYGVVSGGTVELSATITNTAASGVAVTTGIRSGIGSINDEIYNTKTTNLPAGESTTVTHRHSPTLAGGYGYYMSYAIDIASVTTDVAFPTD